MHAPRSSGSSSFSEKFCFTVLDNGYRSQDLGRGLVCSVVSGTSEVKRYMHMPRHHQLYMDLPRSESIQSPNSCCEGIHAYVNLDIYIDKLKPSQLLSSS